ncbi:hypothetical protein [Ponticaulis sp.]|uniref:hypothetical protein n=1 Tax=Ponticaulis sp. TaxID=2020902 RepID=UPI000C5797B5|nr:hypothetical protein [Ponticaulis sp.]MAJ09281.1 hypothetical protein [Ponticaulis sp.]HBH89518.1 hypothetical protein [Hyphomonadaceae bacterium]HBJ91953.1 hypothetical protein [Hyphomonadaceae bacterium]
MSLAKLALCAAVLTGLPALAQANDPDCNSPSAALFQTCATEPEPEVSEEASDDDPAFRWGQTLSFQQDDEQMARRVTSVDIVTVTLSDGQKVPYVETVFEDGSIEERSPTLAETEAWREAISRDPDLERLPATAAMSHSGSALQSESSSWSLEGGFQSANTNNDNPARDRLEERLEIPESRRGRDGRQCSEYESPDGSTRSSSCSQTWGWSSED